MSNSDSRAASRDNVTHNNTWESLNTGCLQRIADAAEKMAVNHSQLLNSLDYYKRRSAALEQRVEELKRKVAALRGVITKLKQVSDDAHV